MLKTWVVGDDQVLSHTKGKGKHKKGGTKLHRIASEPYSVQVQRMQEVHRTLTDSASYHSANALDDKEEDSRQKRRHAPLQRRPSLKRPWKGDGCGGSRVSPVKKSVTWIDKEIPGRSISEYHLITPRSFRSDRGTWRDRSSVAVQNRSQSRISLHTNQQLQYYYYHQQASKSIAWRGLLSPSEGGMRNPCCPLWESTGGDGPGNDGIAFWVWSHNGSSKD